jgi:hypothetical protein
MALWQHGEKESKEEALQKEGRAETRRESDRRADCFNCD